MKEGIKDNLVDLRTTMKYRNGETKTLYGLTTQCPLKTSEDTKDQGFEVGESRSLQHLDCYWNNL